MITGKEMKQGMVDVDKEHIFISFNVAEIREELSEYVWEFDPDNNEGTYLGDPNTVVSNLWIEEAILGVREDFSYEYDSWSEMRDKIVEDVVYRTKHELKSKTPVSMVTGVLANDQTRGGNNAS